MNNLEEFFKDPFDFIETATIDELIEIAIIADKAFFNGESIMTDEEYDLIIDRIKVIDPNNNYLIKVGAPISDNQIITSKNKVVLPYKMGSMDKIRPEHIDQLNNFKKKYPQDWIVSDKLDGVSALLIIEPNNKAKLYTRGNGLIGTDISNLLSIINIKIKKTNTTIVIRGELIISKKNFAKYKDEMANARNMVSGIVNAKNIDKKKAKDIDFVAYEMLEPWSSFSNQYSKLGEINMKVVHHTPLLDLTFIHLSEILKKRKIESDYECDGIIICYNNPIIRIETATNPDYAFAFKNLADQDSAIVKVIDVEWNISKDGYIKPRLVLEPTKLSGVIISHVTAFNAKYILENKIGPGTIIKLVRSGDVIPHILEIIKQSNQAQMPEINFKWNDSGVDIIADANSNEQKIKELAFFCSKLDIKNISEGVITKFIQAGIDSIPKILSVTKNELETVENFKDKMINKIFSSIHDRAKTMTLVEFMIASNTFGHGIGEKKIKKILDTYPDIIYQYIEKNDILLIDQIKTIDGFDTITATKFIKSMPIFLYLLNLIPEEIQSRILLEEVKETNQVNNKFEMLKIVFSGFRNKDWEKIIVDNGGEVITAVSKNTSILVSNKEDIIAGTNSKIKKAKELGIKIMNQEEFKKEFID